nr:unnamed protein product [Callosobruchus analis]
MHWRQQTCRQQINVRRLTLSVIKKLWLSYSIIASMNILGVTTRFKTLRFLLFLKNPSCKTILFMEYTTDLPSKIHHNWKLHCYADDCQIYRSCYTEDINDSIAELNENLTVMEQWSTTILLLHLKDDKAQFIRSRLYGGFVRRRSEAIILREKVARYAASGRGACIVGRKTKAKEKNHITSGSYIF